MEYSNLRGAFKYHFGSSELDIFNLKNETKINEELLFDNPAELGIVTGILTTACIFNLRFTVLKEEFFKDPLHLEHIEFKAMVNFIFNVICFCIISPLVFSSLFLLYVYRCIVALVLKIQLSKKFVGLLEGTDCVWAIEESSCRSVINVLGILEVAQHLNTADLLYKFRELAREKLLGQDAKFDKLSWLRKQKYGYFYWERSAKIDINEYVRYLETIDGKKRDEKELTEESMNKMISNLCSQPLPQDDQASWEILITKNNLEQNFNCFKYMEEGLIFPGKSNSPKNKIRIPIIFRIHHTLGDGPALLRLLLSTIADSDDVELLSKEKGVEIFSKDKIKEVCGVDPELLLQNKKNIIGASMPFSLMINPSFKEMTENYLAMKYKKFVSFHDAVNFFFKFNIAKVKELIEHITNIVLSKILQAFKISLTLIEMPNCFVQQLLRSMDNSALHGPKLSGDKITSLWIESEMSKSICGESLLIKIQQVKNATGTKCGDVILAALSASLQKYFKQIGEFAPKTLTVVIPARMSDSDNDSRLENGFSVGLLPLSICGSTEAQVVKNLVNNKNELTVMERLFDVARNSLKLRSGPDYLINFWVMKWLAPALPEFLLRPIIESRSTMVFSNVPGPRQVNIFGQKLRNIVFWVPQKGTTGIGFSVLSYGGKIHLGLVADKAVIQSDKLLNEILENTVKEIDNLYEIIFMSNFTRSLNNLPTASTNTDLESCE